LCRAWTEFASTLTVKWQDAKTVQNRWLVPRPSPQSHDKGVTGPLAPRWLRRCAKDGAVHLPTGDGEGPALSLSWPNGVELLDFDGLTDMSDKLRNRGAIRFSGKRRSGCCLPPQRDVASRKRRSCSIGPTLLTGRGTARVVIPAGLVPWCPSWRVSLHRQLVGSHSGIVSAGRPSDGR
jgi:hypothetical protein